MLLRVLQEGAHMTRAAVEQRVHDHVRRVGECRLAHPENMCRTKRLAKHHDTVPPAELARLVAKAGSHRDMQSGGQRMHFACAEDLDVRTQLSALGEYRSEGLVSYERAIGTQQLHRLRVEGTCTEGLGIGVLGQVEQVACAEARHQSTEAARFAVGHECVIRATSFALLNALQQGRGHEGQGGEVRVLVEQGL